MTTGTRNTSSTPDTSVRIGQPNPPLTPGGRMLRALTCLDRTGRASRRRHPQIHQPGQHLHGAGRSLSIRGPATILEPPEGDSAIALVDLRAPSADSAVAAAWRAYKPDASWPVKVVNDKPDKDGCTDIRTYGYQTSPKRA